MPSAVPDLAGRDLHALDDRSAIGLPTCFVDHWDADTIARHVSDLAGRSRPELAAVVEDPDAPAEQRWGAGALLALLGDPRIDVDGPEMIEVEAARTVVGLPEHLVPMVAARWGGVGVQEKWIRKECPAHLVSLDAYRIMRRPVTNGEYRAFLRDTGGTALPSSWRFGVFPMARANHPVWTVRAEDAESYARWLSGRTARVFRLPTEAEWEHASHGGTEREYPWGDTFDPTAANTAEAGPLDTTPVGMYPRGRSPLGVDDLAGNVEEHVADDYAPYPGGQAVDDDLSARSGQYKMTRGGAFTRFGDLARCRRRHGWFDREIYPVGFRLAETP